MNKATLSDLNDHLFTQMERLNNANLTGNKLVEELSRSKAVSDIAKNIVLNGRLVLDAEKAKKERLIGPAVPMLEGGKKT